MLLTTQHLEEADRLADRIAVLHTGRIVASGTARELKGLFGSETVEVIDAQGAVMRMATDGTLHGLRRAVDELVAAGAQGTVTLHRPSLDDVFLTLTRSADPAAATDGPGRS